MQTFLPLPSFADSARVLDYRRLGKQRVEGLQVLNALTGRSSGWRTHSATRMWIGHTYALSQYVIAVCDEWTARGYRDTVRQKVEAIVEADQLATTEPDLPDWWRNTAVLQRVCASHRSNLLRKDPVFYGQFGWVEAPDLPYVWPSTPHQLSPLRPMSETETVVTTPAANPAEEAIKAFITEQRAAITDAIGEKAVARANKRLDVAQHILLGNAKTLARQVLIANRPRRAPKAEVAEATA